MSAPDVQPAGQDDDERFDVIGMAESENLGPWVVGCGQCSKVAELRVVVEGLRTQLAAAGEESDAVCARLIQERDALTHQVAAVKALQSKRSLGLFPHGAAKVEGWNECIAAIEAALESRLG